MPHTYRDMRYDRSKFCLINTRFSKPQIMLNKTWHFCTSFNAVSFKLVNTFFFIIDRYTRKLSLSIISVTERCFNNAFVSVTLQISH